MERSKSPSSTGLSPQLTLNNQLFFCVRSKLTSQNHPLLSPSSSSILVGEWIPSGGIHLVSLLTINKAITRAIRIIASNSHFFPKLKNPSPFLLPFLVFSPVVLAAALPFFDELPDESSSSSFISFLSALLSLVGIFTFIVTK